MKIFSYLCCVVLLCPISVVNCYDNSDEALASGAEEAKSIRKSPMQPENEVSVSQDAIDRAASPRGGYAVFGIGLGGQKYGASLAGGAGKFTENRIGAPSIILGGGITNTLKNNFVVGIDGIIHFSRRRKIKGSWADLNADLNSQEKETPETESPEKETTGNRTGSLESNMIGPSIGLRSGYWIRRHKTAIFGKLGVAMLSGRYNYSSENNLEKTVNVTSFSPQLGFGAEIRLSKKMGLIFEYNFTTGGAAAKQVKEDEHRIRLNRTDVRIMGTYSLS